jgi:hypothetical protein
MVAGISYLLEAMVEGLLAGAFSSHLLGFSLWQLCIFFALPFEHDYFH